MTRRVVQFSCGAASAVAAKLTLAKHPDAVVVNAFLVEEHPDNQRFLRDVERWLGVSIVQLRDDKYGASAYEVFRRVRYVKGQFGAPCSLRLKREVLAAWARPDDVPILGYTVEEQDRADRYLDANNGKAEFPLIDAGLSKADCLGLIARAGIELPAMYRLGFNNANCIGCPKGGEGYWNHVRKVFPERYEEMAKIQDMLGEGSYFFRDRKTDKRISLRQLDPNAGRHDEPDFECGFACLYAEDQWRVSGGAA